MASIAHLPFKPFDFLLFFFTLASMSLAQDAARVLHEGGVVAHPTETCYGLAVDIFQRAAVEKLYRLKKMPFDKPVSLLVRDLKEAQQYGEFSPKALELAKKYWPGPLTLVVPRSSHLPFWINPGHPTVGFRVSSNKKTREMIEAFGGPITTTSANVSTQPQAYEVQAFLDQGLQPDFVINGGKLAETAPSTIVEVLGDQLRVLREGPLALE